MASSSSTGNALTINPLDSSDDDFSIPPSSGITFRRDEPDSRPSHPPPARVSTSTHKKARTSTMDSTTDATSTAYWAYNTHPADAEATSHQNHPPFASSHTYGAAVSSTKKPAPPPPIQLDSVWLVYHQKEPYYHSAWSYDSHLRYGPSSIDKICVGVYDSKTLADAGSKYYWEKQVRKPVSYHAEMGLLGGYFYDGMDSGCVNTLSHRVYVEPQSLNPVRPAKTDHDKTILQLRGRR
jgi:hypothetical protein